MMTDTIALADLTQDHFRPLIGSGFRVAWPEHEETLTLISSTPLKTSSLTTRPGFSLIFNGESTAVLLQQHIHPLEHPTLGRLDIFLVPVGRNPDGTHRYQAVFN